MQRERFCNNCYKIAPCFGEKYNSDDHRLAADIDLPIGDGQITAQLIFIHAVGQLHRYAAAAAGEIEHAGALPCRGPVVPDNSAAADLVPHRAVQRQGRFHILAAAQEAL